VLTFPPYGQAPNPLPATARNYYHSRGAAAIGASCCGTRTSTIGHRSGRAHEIEVPIKYRYYDGYLQAKHRKIAVMYCEDETDWRNEIKLEEAEFRRRRPLHRLRERSGGGGTGGGTGTSPGETGGTGGGTPAAAQSGGSSGGCGSIRVPHREGLLLRTTQAAGVEERAHVPEQAVLVAAAGAGSCITFQEITVCTPCIGPGDTSQVCANVETKVDCVCSCSCSCNCGDSGGGGYPSSGGDSGGGGKWLLQLLLHLYLQGQVRHHIRVIHVVD